jgi:D-serine deaminase-like pyridoxal phosphate-dependent protein
MWDALDQTTQFREGAWRTPIDWHAKGFPPVDAPVNAADVAAQGWNLFDGSFLLPTMVVHRDALEHNIALIADFCATNGVSLAPHGKTTMAPDIFARQLAAGAWAMTLATPWQARVAATVGVPRILIGNEVTDPAGIDWIGTTLDGAGPEVFCWVDSVAGVELLDARLGGHERRLQVLLEVGQQGGRGGVRSVDEALAVARRVGACGSLRLAGVTCFEGFVDGATQPQRDEAARALMGFGREVAVALEPLIAADGGTQILLSAGGSQYLDIVVEALVAPLGTRLPVHGVLRSGGTVSHDHGGMDLVSPFGSVRAAGGPQLHPALEVWAPVVSMPEPGRAIAGAGKRDLPHDGALPIVLAIRDTAGTLRRLDEDGAIRVVRLNDQHAWLEFGADASLAVGDLVAFGIRHACTAFDRWRFIPVVDEDYDVIDAFETVF